MDRKLIEYLPEWLREFREIKELTDIEQSQTEDLWEALEKMWNNNFIESLDEQGCEHWERMLGISNKDTYTLEERRLKILGIVTEQRPFTVISLEKTLAVICGNDESKGPNYSVKLDANNYVLTVRVALTSKNVLSDVAKLLDRVVPSNLLIDLSLLYNKNNQLSKFTHLSLRHI